MSGLEIAGLVLGTFPIALEVLDKYKEAARRFGFWLRIAAEHQKCDSKLQFQRLLYINNLRHLLLPMAMFDDAGIEDLLSDPGGQAWKKNETTSMLKQRLGSSYDLYQQCMAEFKEALGAMNHELALEPDHSESQTVQASDMRHVHRFTWPEGTDVAVQVSQQLSSTLGKTKAKAKWQTYRLKFSQRAKERDQLFAELQNCNERLKALLQISKDDNELAQNRAFKKGKLGNAALCKLWREASMVFRALSKVWKCDCQAQHSTKLLLEHRTKGISEFNLLFEKIIQPRHEMRKIRISPRNTASISIAPSIGKPALQESLPIFEPSHRSHAPKMSVLRNSREPSRSPNLRTPPSITLTAFESAAAPASTQEPGPITSLCLSLNQADGLCCGYLPQDDCQYFVYKIPDKPVSSPSFITLDQLLRKQRLPMPKRRQRFALAWILSSSFLQLLESPWLPGSWQKTDIVFYQDAEQPGRYALDQPHLNHRLAPREENSALPERDRRMQLSSSLEMLGIVLLELCFGELLEEQPCRTQHSSSGCGPIERIFDVAAAKEWHGEVEEDAGYEYAVAVGWCLGGILSAPPDKWREEMLQKVVHPLESCHAHLSQRVDIVS